MYEVDERDRVVPLEGVPRSTTGSPEPLLIADDSRLVLAYYCLRSTPILEVSPKMADQGPRGEHIAIVRFNRKTHMFGPPNDEALEGHPLACRGLQSYGAFRVDESSWIRQLEKMNCVHSRHNPEILSRLQHLVFTFHDSTFECVCNGFDVRTTVGLIDQIVPTLFQLLRDKS